MKKKNIWLRKLTEEEFSHCRKQYKVLLSYGFLKAIPAIAEAYTLEEENVMTAIQSANYLHYTRQYNELRGENNGTSNKPETDKYGRPI